MILDTGCVENANCYIPGWVPARWSVQIAWYGCICKKKIRE